MVHYCDNQAEYLVGKSEFLKCRKNDYWQSLFLSISLLPTALT